MSASSYAETIHRLVRRLSAEYDLDSPHEAAPHLGFPSLPQHLGHEIISLPCLSILPSPSSSSHHYGYDLNYNLHPLQQDCPYDPSMKLDSVQHEHFVESMDRVVKYKQNSIPHASHSLLRNLIKTFGTLLELQIQRMIYNVMESKNKPRSSNNNSGNTNGNTNPDKRDDDEVLKKFTELPTSSTISSSKSLVVPELALTTFSTMLPIEHWQEKDDISNSYDNIQLRLMFHAEITVRITPNDALYTATLKAPGHVMGSFSHGSSICRNHCGNMTKPELLDLQVDTRVLYNSIRRECKIISKKVVNAIVGFELMKPKSGRKSRGGTMNSKRTTVAPVVNNGNGTNNSNNNNFHGKFSNVTGGTSMSGKPSPFQGGTYQTEMTAMSSLDGRDYRSMSLGQDDFNKMDHMNSHPHNNHQHHHQNLSVASSSSNNNKVLSISVDGRSISSMNSSSGTGGGLNPVLNDDEQVNRSVAANFSIIYEESMDDVTNSKKSKKKTSGWKRLVTPASFKRSSTGDSSSSRHDLPSTPIHHQYDTGDVVVDSSEKKHSRRWKRLLSTSKQ